MLESQLVVEPVEGAEVDLAETYGGAFSTQPLPRVETTVAEV